MLNAGRRTHRVRFSSQWPSPALHLPSPSMVSSGHPEPGAETGAELKERPKHLQAYGGKPPALPASWGRCSLSQGWPMPVNMTKLGPPGTCMVTEHHGPSQAKEPLAYATALAPRRGDALAWAARVLPASKQPICRPNPSFPSLVLSNLAVTSSA